MDEKLRQDKQNELIRSKIGTLFPNGANEQAFDFPIEIFGKLDIKDLFNESKRIMNMMVEYQDLMMMYNCAIMKMRTKFEIFDTEFNVRHQRNPINFVNTRLKSSRSILEKMNRNHIPFSIENLEENINDVAGIRVVCSYVDDIYLLADTIIKQDDVELIDKKDYIANPKPNGYRSMHLIVKIPVFFANQTKYIKVEVQIRTIAMDFWATLEHQLRYKNLSSGGEEIAARLKECANIITDTDLKMLEIRKKIEINTRQPTEEEVLFEKMKKLNFQ